MIRSVAVFCSIFLAGCTALLSEAIPYPDSPNTATYVPLKAAATGSVTGYFGGSSAGDTSTVALYDVTAGTTSAYAFSNHSTIIGAMVDFGHVTSGDLLLFLLYNATTGTTLFSNTQNGDGFAHAYATSFGGGMLGSAILPAGTYVAFEDLLGSQGSDFDYNDSTFVFTNVDIASTMTPEPNTLLLLGTGVLGSVGTLRRRIARG